MILIFKKNPARRILSLRRGALATYFPAAAVRSRPEGFWFHRMQFPMKPKQPHTTPPSRGILWGYHIIFWIIRLLLADYSALFSSAGFASRSLGFMLKLMRPILSISMTFTVTSSPMFTTSSTFATLFSDSLEM